MKNRSGKRPRRDKGLVTLKGGLPGKVIDWPAALPSDTGRSYPRAVVFGARAVFDANNGKLFHVPTPHSRRGKKRS